MNCRFSVVDAFGALICFTFVLCLSLPFLVQTRAKARLSSCDSNLKDLGLAVHDYHDAYKRLPAGCGGTVYGGKDDTKKNLLSNRGQLGPMVGLTPFMNMQLLWERISYPKPNSQGINFSPMGPAPWFDADQFEPWKAAPMSLRCPEIWESLEGRVVRQLGPSPGSLSPMTSYVFCFGDSFQGTGLPPKDAMFGFRSRGVVDRGAFRTTNLQHGMRSFLDGTSNTVLASECIASSRGSKKGSEIFNNVEGITLNPSKCLEEAGANGEKWAFGRGARWAHGIPAMTGFHTILPPNSPSCTEPEGLLTTLASASSLHPDGVITLFTDGSTKFITNSIDTGNLHLPVVSKLEGHSKPGNASPYGLWGAIGTRESQERIDLSTPAIQPFPNRNSNQNSKEVPEENEKWHSSDGKQVTATFIEVKDKEIVRLKAVDGTIREVPLNTLEANDMIRAVKMQLMRE